MQGQQISMPPLSKINKVILIVLAIAFLIISALQLADIHVAAFLVLAKETFLGFQLLTYLLVESSIMSLIFNGLLLWFIGGELERVWGSRSYLRFLLSLALGAAVIFLGVSFTPLAQVFASYQGIGGLMMGLLVAYAVLFGERELHFMFIFPLKAKYFVLLIAAIQLYTAFFTASKLVALAHVLTMVFAYGYLYMKYRNSRRQQRSERFKKHQRDVLKKSFKLIKNDDEPPRYWQ